MKKDIKIIDKDKGMVRVTMAGERFYIRTEYDEENLPFVLARPSSTWIASYYYTSPYLIKWLQEKGITESERIKNEAGDKGSRIHKTIDMWLEGKEITIDTKIPNEELGIDEELTPEDNEAFKSFLDFYKEVKPKILAHNYTVWHEKYAGTIDILCEINGEVGILDIKTGQGVYTEHKLQLSSYKWASQKPEEIKKLWILQVGYRYNKWKWKLTEVEDKIKLFGNAYDTWLEENTDKDGKLATPKYIEYPITYQTLEQLNAESKANLEKISTEPKITAKK